MLCLRLQAGKYPWAPVILNGAHLTNSWEQDLELTFRSFQCQQIRPYTDGRIFTSCFKLAKRVTGQAVARDSEVLSTQYSARTTTQGDASRASTNTV